MRIFFVFFVVLLVLPVVWPPVDLLASGLFYRAGQGFYLANMPVFVALHWLAYYGARALGVAFAFLAVAARRRRRLLIGLDAKAWLFLLLALLIGPVLIANLGFKDHWGRARPREVVAFGGVAAFSPALIPQSDVRPNGSFVSGDGAFGFFLPAFAYVVPRRLSHRVFGSAMLAASLFGFARLVMGAHFLSDIFYAAALMLVSSAAVYGAMYGWGEMVARYKAFFRRAKDDAAL